MSVGLLVFGFMILTNGGCNRELGERVLETENELTNQQMTIFLEWEE